MFLDTKETNLQPVSIFTKITGNGTMGIIMITLVGKTIGTARQITNYH